MRLDSYLVLNGYFSTKSKAQNCIRNSKCQVNGVIISKCGYEVNNDVSINILQAYDKYVSFGGYKLEKALNEFNIDLTNKIVLDIGASSGGFTDCCLQHHALKVYAYDVGHDQLVDSIRNDPKVIVKEGINCRNLTNQDFTDKIDFICMDVSFISCTCFLEAISDILPINSEAVILFKPQFEVGNQYLNNKGVVTEQNIVFEKLNDCLTQAKILKLECVNKTKSVVKQINGNQEYLLYFRRVEC